MSTRNFGWLLAIAVVVIAVAVSLSSPRHSARETARSTLVLPELKPALNAVTRLRISKGDGSQVTLERAAGDWQVAERHYPADSGRVRKLLLDFASLSVVEEKTRDPNNYAVLGVDTPAGAASPGALVEITTAGPLTALMVGKPAGSKQVYVRRRDSAVSLLATPQITLDPAPKSWIDRSLLDVSSDRVRSVEVSVPAAPRYTAERTSRADPDLRIATLPKGRTLASPTTPDAALSTLTGLSIEDVRARAESPSAATPAPAAPYECVVKTFDGLVVELGGHEEGEHRYLRVSAHFDPASRSPEVADNAAPASAAAPAPSASPLPSATPAPAGAPGSAAAARPPVLGRAGSGGAHTSNGALMPVASVEQEAERINSRANGSEFELARYRFDAIFRSLDSMLNASAQPASKSVARAPRSGATPARSD